VRGRTAVLVDAMTPLGQRGGRGLIWGGAVMVKVESSRDICEQLTDFGVTTRLHPLPREGLRREATAITGCQRARLKTPHTGLQYNVGA
jgi:hypothetical protein